MIVWTIGHSTHSADAFVNLLRAHAIERLVDIRTVPRSRRNPQFNRDELPGTLAAAGIAYLHIPGLGGLRRPLRDSQNTAWRNDSFRGYADYMQTAEFSRSLEELILTSERQRVSIMCAEALPWQCHRSLVSDALVAQGVAVLHIFSDRSSKPHTVTSFARIEGKRVTYPGLPIATQE
jgi:uncharacterized protein (DUF488 family)